MGDESGRTEEETKQTVVGIESFELIEQSGDDVMSAGGLTAAEDDTNVDGFLYRFLTGDELYHRHSVGVGEQAFYYLLVADTAGGLAFDRFDISFQCHR